MAQFLTLINRSSKTLIGTWNGRQHLIKPGKHEFPDYMAYKFKDQNPVMGSEDVRTGHVDYLIGILEEGDPIDPMEQNPNAVEKWDRSKLNARPSEIVPGDNGLYSRSNLAPGPSDGTGAVKSGFTKAD